LVTDYLMEEVLTRQPPEIREFLAVTSVLERFSPQLCDELLAGSNRESFGRSRELLDRLYKQNLFLGPLGPVHGWYRYHQLFRQLLLERFDELMSATAQADILKRAGAWFCSKGWTEDGLKCFLAAGDLDEAADVIGNRLHDVIADELSRRTLARWLEMFPSGAERTRLPLLVASAY
jgi:LuxR family maltose regulon positive regulatory protein